jgi:hypothetical protein
MIHAVHKYTVIVEWFDTDREVGEMYTAEFRDASLAVVIGQAERIIKTLSGMVNRVVDCSRIERNSDEAIVWTWERPE